MAKKKSTSDAYKKLLEKVQGMNLGGGGFWKPGQGRSTIRVLPGVGGMDYFFLEVGQHYVENTSYMCPLICSDGKQDCPICEVNEMLFQSGEKEAASQFRVRRGFWMNIIVRGDEGAGPRMFTPGITIFQAIASLISDPDYGDVTDEDDGFDIKIDRKGDGLETKYQVIPARNPSPLSDDDDDVEEWLDAAEDIKGYVAKQMLGYDELAKKSGVSIYLDGVGEEEENEEEDDGFEDAEDGEEESAVSLIDKRMQRRNKRRRNR